MNSNTMSNEIIKKCDLDSFMLAIEQDEKGNTYLVAENKAKNFKVIWGSDQLMTSVIPGAIDTAAEDERQNVLNYTEMLLDVIYCVANIPLSSEEYDEMFKIYSKHVAKDLTLPDDITQEQLEGDLALAHAAEDAYSEEKMDKMVEEVQEELERNTSKEDKQ